MSKKKQVLLKLFEVCSSKGDFKFHNTLVKQISAEIGFGNPFDATKIDQRAGLPEELLAQDYFVIHLGEGWHQFVKGVAIGYHTIEAIEAHEQIQKSYTPSLLNHVDTSESTVLSFINNQKSFRTFYMMIPMPLSIGIVLGGQNFHVIIGLTKPLLVSKTNRLKLI